MLKWYKRQPVTIRAAVLGGMFVLVAAVFTSSISIIVRSCEPKVVGDSLLQLVDATIAETDEFPKLDIKLRNIGDKVAFLKRATIHVDKLWVFRPTGLPSAEPVSWNYDIILPIKDTPYSVPVEISQVIKPDSTDRFTLSLGNNASQGAEQYVFLIMVELCYDEDNKTLVTGKIAFLANAAASILGMYFPGGDFYREVTVENKRIVNELRQLEVYKSKNLLEIMSVIEGLPDEAQ